ncbi:glutamine amidotransferase [Tetragenococcus muriaticus]|uniref:Putative cytoplasmic protein n=1 Tax=Tetragenococcus muriaticus 3MR10-3 TaxID=1302648 RepID=A0A091C0E3_9ENTE|nr:glutamine amidotransferase [Tetragenococcus muriaticus]KFN89527.1 putative cytoplasmic protein [Tetragenococcus muriaticus 3MR10-3]GMA47997.1 hypothetical protein GCM10025854_22470 [Tetragenococcus muriaticus]
MRKVLLAGESWTIHSIHQKGFDSFTTTTYETGIKWFKKAIESQGYELTHIPNHLIQYNFPETVEELNQFDIVVLSDIGSNTFLLPDLSFSEGQQSINKLEVIKRYVSNGGKLLMAGGYISFSGIDGKSRYENSPLREVLPVNCLGKDDRVEVPEGVVPYVSNHEVFEKIPKNWPHFLGYNKTSEKQNTEVLATINGDPFIVIGDFGKGKSVAFTSDIAPHWGSEEFVNWEYYPVFWNNLFQYLDK